MSPVFSLDLVIGVLVGVTIGWLSLALLIQRLDPRRRARRDALLPRDSATLAQPGSRALAEQAAAIRAQKIRRFLEGPGNQVFREIPPGFGQAAEDGSLDALEIAAQRARLVSELESVPALLLARLTDAIEEACARYGDAVPTAMAEPRRRSPEDLFPWKLVVEAPEEWLRVRLDAVGLRDGTLEEWLPLEIATRPTRSVANYHACIESGAMNGRLGGWIHAGDEQLLMTCSHVLAPSCRSVVLRTRPWLRGTPDLGLVTPSPCFPESLRGPGRRSRPASQSTLERWGMSRESVVIAHPWLLRRRGRVIAIASTLFLGTQTIRFPHSQVVPQMTLRDFLCFWRPPWFAKPGDSGAWMYHPKSGEWGGMVTCGDNHENAFVFVALSSALLGFLSASPGLGLVGNDVRELGR